jgi:hypothetical protein
VLRQAGQDLRLERFSAHLSGEDGLEFSIQGEIDDLLGSRRANLAAELHIADPELLEALTGFRLSPTTASAVIKVASGEIDLDLTAMVGQTQLETSGILKYSSDRIEGLQFSINTAQMFLDDFDLQAEKRESGELYKPIEHLEDAAPKGVLEQIIGHSPQYPTDIAISIGGITGDNVDIDKLEIQFKGENNRYMLRRFTAHYDHSVAEVRGIIDLNPVPPVFSLGAEILAVDMNELITDLGIDSDIRGTLTLRSGITARGDTSEALLGSLNGSLALALENAEIEGAAYDVLATDFLGWLFSGAALESSTHIDCTRGVFKLSNGRASSDNLFMETRHMIATGEGSLDLVKNTMDITITPKSKTRIGQIPSSITLKGDFKDPKVSVSAISAGADLYSELLLIVPNFFMKIFGRERAPKEEACVAAIIN